MKRIVLTHLILLLAIMAYGQETDKTEYIVNPSFENSTNGWSVDGLGRQNNTSFSLKAGTYYMDRDEISSAQQRIDACHKEDISLQFIVKF